MRILGVLVVMAMLFAVNTLEFSSVDLSKTLEPPSVNHPFGTDQLGRDVFARTVVGTINSLAIATTVRVSAIIIGVVFGSTAGFFGGRVDDVMMRLVDVFMAFPDLLLAIGFSVAFGDQTVLTMMIILTMVSWPAVARLARSQALVAKSQEFVTAAIALGANSFYIIGRHIISQSWETMQLLFALGLGSVIMAEASLSFLGLGVLELVTLGGQIQGGFPYLLNAPWITLCPAMVLGVVVFFCMNRLPG